MFRGLGSRVDSIGAQRAVAGAPRAAGEGRKEPTPPQTAGDLAPGCQGLCPSCLHCQVAGADRRVPAELGQDSQASSCVE